jgi:hypothetical protein
MICSDCPQLATSNEVYIAVKAACVAYLHCHSDQNNSRLLADLQKTVLISVSTAFTVLRQHHQ